MTELSIKEAADQHRRHTSKVAQSREKSDNYRAKRHTMKDISFSAPIRVLCTCGWQVGAKDAPTLELLWKTHKQVIGEKPR